MSGPYRKLECRGGDMWRPCPHPVTWQITTAAGASPFCDEHAKFYLDKGRAVYPAERIETPLP